MGGQAKTPEAAADAFKRLTAAISQAAEAFEQFGIAFERASKPQPEGVGGDSPASSPATRCSCRRRRWHRLAPRSPPRAPSFGA